MGSIVRHFSSFFVALWQCVGKNIEIKYYTYFDDLDKAILYAICL